MKHKQFSVIQCRVLLAVGVMAPYSLLAEESLVFDQPQVAGIAGFRPMWDTTIPLAADGMTAKGDPFKEGDPMRAEWDPAIRRGQPGAIAFDALQRYALVRFPGAAEGIASKVNKGFVVEKAELVLPWKSTELFPPGNPGYDYRANWGVEDMWRKDPARWHAIAFVLRRPWIADEKNGPTFNAFINDKAYWTHCGARDTEKDRFPYRLGPVEVSYKSPEGRIDVTSVLSSAVYGKTPGERLRNISDCGFVLQKWETYDHRYFNGVYEWGTATGGRAILIDTPKLVVTFVPGKSPPVSPGLAANVPDMAHKLKSGAVGKPTAVLPSSQELAALVVKFAAKPGRMPDWQWQRVQDLQNLGGKGDAKLPFWYSYAPGHLINWAKNKFQAQAGSKNYQADFDREVFGIWVDQILRKQPRGWEGFEASREMNQWYLFGSALPLPAKDAIQTYWTAWLMPDRKTAPLSEHLNPKNTTGELVHPMADQLAGHGGTESYVGDSYHSLTGDWHGNKSFYRSGFNYVMSTQNFNTSAAAGALLGGSIIGSGKAMEDGRYGMEHNLARLWSWGGGNSQEYIDHYYFAITLSNYKAIADFGPSAFDRLMGEALLTKAMEELTSCYHSGLRRFIAGSSRTSMEYLLGKQDGLQYTIHSQSKLGALTDIGGQKGPFGAPLWGVERSAADVGRQTLTNPWLPDWAMNLVDSKPLPYEIYSNTRGAISRGYLAANYGLASNNKGEGRISFMGQWRREAKQAASFKDIVTMDLRYGINQTRWANDAPGWIAPIGKMAAVQQKNKMIVLMSPWPADYIKNVIKKDGLQSLQASVGLFNFQEPGPSWSIFIDGKTVSGLPVKAKQGQKITIQDGTTYLAVIPLAGSNLGRQDEVVLREGEWQYFGNDAKNQGYKASLVIDSYNLQNTTVAKEVTNWDLIDKAHAGFIIEMGDQAEWGGFAKFQQHINQTSVVASYDAGKDVDQVTYKSGNDTLDLGAYTKAETGAPGIIAFQRVNGKDIMLGDGMDRDTTMSLQSRSGRLEKNGAVLTVDSGKLGYLIAESVGGAYVGFSPLSELTHYALTVPGGIKVEADGLLGLCRVVVQPKLNTVDIDFQWKTGQTITPEMVKSFTISGCQKAPQVKLNGQLVKSTPSQNAFVVAAQP